MRPQVQSVRSALPLLRRRATGFGTSRERRARKEQLGARSPLAEPPALHTALGETPEDIPAVPQHIENITTRRLNWYKRTIGKDKFSEAEEAELERAMARVTKKTRPEITYRTGESGPSQERLAFFAEPEAAGAVVLAEDVPGIEAGRVVEVRRMGSAHIGLILAPVLVGGRERLLLLRESGEIWPVSTNDVQFVMPASLVPAPLAQSCWHPDLLALWAAGDEVGLSETGKEAALLGAARAEEMFASRRKVTGLLRRVNREKERMQGRLTGGTLGTGRGGGIETVWEEFAPSDPEQRGSIIAAAAAEFLLNAAEGDKRIAVRPHTLPAYAAHTLLMQRPDLFVGDVGEMWDTGLFLVRSRAERARLAEVARLVDSNDPAVGEFIAKAQRVAELLKEGKGAPEWTPQELDIISVLLLPFFEQRSTQKMPWTPVVSDLLKALGAAGADVVDRAFNAHKLHDLGVLPTTDSLRASQLREAADRAMAQEAIVPVVGSPSATPTPADAALDGLRTDLDHRVFVIDDAGAQELDDGVALERVGDQFWIHIHVADPTRFIERDGDLATSASFDATTQYLPEGTVPLLPSELGGGAVSLGASEGQCTVVLSSRVDTEGNIHETKVALGHIRAAAITTYTAVNAALGIAEPRSTRPFGVLASNHSEQKTFATLTDADAEDLRTLHTLAAAIRRQRFATAGLEWWPETDSSISLLNAPPPARNMFHRPSLLSLPSAPLSPDEVQYGYTVTAAPTTLTAPLMVAELMVLANRGAAAWASERGLALPFRGSTPVRNSSATPADLTVDNVLAKRNEWGQIDTYTMARANLSLPRSVLSATPEPHWLMGLEGYVRATSPLRRFDDMLVHWQLKAALGAQAGLGGAALTADTVLQLAKRADLGHRRAKTAARGASAFWRAGLFAQRMCGPLPSGYRLDGAGVDLRAPLVARISGPTELLPNSQSRTPAHVPALGAGVDVLAGAKRQFTPGEEVQIVLKEARMWPAPVFNSVLHSS